MTMHAIKSDIGLAFVPLWSECPHDEPHSPNRWVGTLPNGTEVDVIGHPCTTARDKVGCVRIQHNGQTFHVPALCVVR